ncbi:hypothetical protein [Marinimicrobium sp. C2-29]|uniref:hypothetical protein n=1 Tax=Marinimicrobium sp. C2-29 TaxID=3139825 RepID=UPI00313969AB
MNRRTLTTWLSALLLLMAGLTSATHGAPAPAEPEPCHEIAQAADMGHEGHHGGHTDHSADTSDEDCFTDCQCCPGSCSGASALTASQWLSPAVIEGGFSAYTLSHPHSTPLELLRPPIEA